MPTPPMNNLLKVKLLGWSKTHLDQISRVERGMIENGCIITDDNPHFIYVHDSSKYEEAIQFYEFCKSNRWKTKLLLKVLDLATHNKSDFSWEKESLLKADAILANSKFVQKQIKEILGLDSTVVYETYDDEIYYQPHIKKTFDFLIIGRLCCSTRRNIWLKELLELPENKGKKLVGVGPEPIPFNRNENYHMGILDGNGLRTLYNNAKIVLVLNKFDGFGLVSVQSACAATPYIICSDNPTAYEFHSPEFICEPNIQSINEKIHDIENNYEFYVGLAKYFGEKFKVQFNKAKIAQNIIEAYNKIP